MTDPTPEQLREWAGAMCGLAHVRWKLSLVYGDEIAANESAVAAEAVATFLRAEADRMEKANA